LAGFFPKCKNRDKHQLCALCYERGISIYKLAPTGLEVSLDYLVGDGDLKVLDKKTLQRLEDIAKLNSDDKIHIFMLSIILSKLLS